MSFGKFYTTEGNARSTAIRAVAKANKLDIEIVELPVPRDQKPTEYLKINPLAKIPSFEGADGYILTESIAIAIYITSQNEKTTLLGKTKQDYASILRWMSYANMEVLPKAGGYFLGCVGRIPFNKKTQEQSLEDFYKVANVVEQHLLINTFLVGERLTLADLFAAGIYARAFQYICDKKWRAANPNTTRWYETVVNQPIYKEVAPDTPMCDELIKNQPPAGSQAPKKEKAAAPPKEAAKPAAKPAPAADDEDDEPAPAPKPKHPLDSLEKSAIPIDEWKRTYSNKETREEALPYFWKDFYNDKDYSLWKVDYKYNDELTLTFMTSNLIGGFFTRLEASRKYIFGCASVYGESNNSIIKGAFVIRGDNPTHAFDVAPDFESYEFTRLDASKPEDREFVDDMWAWDKPIVVEGKEYPWADGKVFK